MLFGLSHLAPDCVSELFLFGYFEEVEFSPDEITHVIAVERCGKTAEAEDKKRD